MSEQRDVDAGILIREDSGKARTQFANPGGGLFHRGWLDVEAEVLECTTPPRGCTPYLAETEGAYGPLPYIVTFRYTVDGKSYEGILNSPDEVERGEKFTIRYDPSHPEKNNTFDSETNWTYTYTKIFSVVMILLMLFLFIRSYFFSA